MRAFSLVLICIILSISVFGYSDEASFIEAPDPIKPNIEGNPLDYSSNKIGQDIRNFPLPLGFRGQYRFGVRFELIDKISNQPLYMKSWAEENAEYFQSNQAREGIVSIGHALFLLKNGNYAPMISIEGIDFSIEPFEKLLVENNIPEKHREAILALYRGFVCSQFMVDSARTRLSKAEIDFLGKNPGYYITKDGEKFNSLTGNIDAQLEFINIARKVRFEYLFLAANVNALSIHGFVEAFQNEGEALQIKEPIIYDSPYGKFIIGTLADDRYEEDAKVIIDPAGNDEYLNNAGGCNSTDIKSSFVIDFSGDDTYNAAENDLCQGVGFLGTGFIADISGNDRYIARHYSQGAGILGIGAIFDAEGNDEYDANAFCQGAGMFGLGMIIENSGNDRYSGATLCQGGATCLGLGMVTDLEGNDEYKLNIDEGKKNLGSAGYGQGGALGFRAYPWREEITPYGGAGVLFDHNGNDDYETKGWCDQGGSYIMSFGCLLDGAGNDNYKANTGQGSAIHITNAILIDKAGDDIYKGGFRSGASGSDHSPGILIDYAGNDEYTAGKACYGTGCKPWNLSLFIDYKGDDRYISNNPKERVKFNDWDSFGGVWPESEPYNWAYAAFMDLSGNDEYQTRLKENNAEIHSFGHGIFLDIEHNNCDIIGNIEDPYPKRKSPNDNLHTSRELHWLELNDNFMHFQAIGNLITQGEKNIDDLVELLMKSPAENRMYNRDIMEVIDYLLANEKLSAKDKSKLKTLLKAEDIETRILIADDLGFWHIENCEQELLNAYVTDTSSFVKYYALYSLLRLNSDMAIDQAMDFAQTSESNRVRRMSIYYISKMVTDDASHYDFFVQIAQSDAASEVIIAAINALSKMDNDKSIEIYRSLADDYDAYIRRAVGRALCDAGEVDGIAILIESLEFPSIDAFFNYNRNVPNTLASYTGQDFDDDSRYDIDKWRDWFEENKNSIDLEYNVAMNKAWDKAIDSARIVDDFAESFKIFNSYLVKYPDNEKAKSKFATMLNSHAWNMVTAPENSEDYDPKIGLKYAKRATELDSQPNLMDTLAEAYLVNGEYKKAREICNRFPDTKMFQDRIKRLDELQK